MGTAKQQKLFEVPIILFFKKERVPLSSYNSKRGSASNKIRWLYIFGGLLLERFVTRLGSGHPQEGTDCYTDVTMQLSKRHFLSKYGGMANMGDWRSSWCWDGNVCHQHKLPGRMDGHFTKTYYVGPNILALLSGSWPGNIHTTLRPIFLSYERRFHSIVIVVHFTVADPGILQGVGSGSLSVNLSIKLRCV